MKREGTFVPDLCRLFHFGQDFWHERLPPEPRDNSHDQKQINLFKIRFHCLQRSGRVQSDTTLATSMSDHLQGVSNLVAGLRLGVNGDQVGPRFEKSWDVVLRLLDHQVHIEENIIGCVNSFHHCRSERDIFNKMPVHDVEVQPICASGDRPRAFFRNTGKICSQYRRCDDAVGVAPFFHVFLLTAQRCISRFPIPSQREGGFEICRIDNFRVWLLVSLCLPLVSE